MHHLFEQWAQSWRKSKEAVIGTTTKGLTHNRPATHGGVLNFLRRLPVPVGITAAQVASDKYPYLSSDCDKNSTMPFPTISPDLTAYNTNSMPVTPGGPAQCLGGSPGSSSPVTPVNNKFHQSDSTFSTPQPSINAQEVSKSSLWKHIFAPPFTPKCSSSTTRIPNPYGSSPQQHLVNTDLSNLYPYTRMAGGGVSENTYTTTATPACVYSGNQCYPRPPCYGGAGLSCFSNQMSAPRNFVAFTPLVYSSFVAPSVPYVFATAAVSRLPYPVQQQAQQHVNSPRQHQQTHVTTPTTSKLPPNKCTNAADETPQQQPQYTHRVRLTIKSLPETEQDFSGDRTEIPNEADRIQSSHVSGSLETLDVRQRNSSESDSGLSSSTATTTTPQVPSCAETLNQISDCDTNESEAVPVAFMTFRDSDVRDFEDLIPTQHSGSPLQKTKKAHQTLKIQAEKTSSNKDEAASTTRPPCTPHPNISSRKKRKCRPSAEKRRRRRMAVTGTVLTKAGETNEDSMTHTARKLKTEQPKPESTDNNSMSATVAFILGMDSEEDEDEVDGFKATTSSSSNNNVKTLCFSISPSYSDSDSDFDVDNDFDDDLDDSSNNGTGFDEVAWAQLNVSLNPFNFNCLSSAPVPITKTMSSPELMTYGRSGTCEKMQHLVGSPTRRTCVGKHVKFASDDLLVTIHTIEEELDAYQEARKGHWELYALDRCRFKNRTMEVEKSISWVFNPEHRARVFSRLQSSCSTTQEEDSSQL